MKYIDIVLPIDTVEELFPCTGEEGTNVQASTRANTVATALMGLGGAIVAWKLPDAFAVRYGSSYVATATVRDTSVRFHMDQGDFREGDDK
jgi:hypothetical protein